MDADQTCFADSALRHTVYITRIYFNYGDPGQELIGNLRATVRIQLDDPTHLDCSVLIRLQNSVVRTDSLSRFIQ